MMVETYLDILRPASLHSGTRMNKQIATQIIACAVAMDEPIGNMHALIEQMEEDEVKERFKKAVGDLMGILFLNIVRPIETLYPDLNPDL
ncbi:hypothetical protein PY365_18405 [Roseiarcaceae bacterium H3SJ34-1]|uniref:hypothetical protein n=1 Tax=Terripilifer ovatus TaxID=3032367 RepID=UPI003AB9441B|nr:hypothetical protein [Roseiarcaceae bacterium H3SJ34-1]